ncbi:GNAT family N-acetyltransferase [bacterium]|nr:GNAT family N-acetyltransferase [candidate division CSSED10-310 bacterium]
MLRIKRTVCFEGREKDELAIRTFEPQDRAGIDKLFKLTFGWTRPESLWKWKFMENPHGQPIIIVAVDRGEIVGHYGLLPRRIRCFDTAYTALQEVDLMVHPDHKKGGLFKKLGETAYGYATRDDPSFTFGFPNQVSLPLGSRILKWRAIGKIPMYSIFLDPCTSMIKKYPRLKTVRMPAGTVRFCMKKIMGTKYASEIPCRITDTIPSGIAGLFAATSRIREFAFERDGDYLKWRYESRPEGRYRFLTAGTESKPQGFAVHVIKGNDAFFTEFILDPSDNVEAARSLIGAGIRLGLENGVSAQRIWLLENDLQSRLISRMGFMRRESKIYHVIRSFLSPEHNRRLWDPCRWQVTMGDSDCI